MCYCTPNIRTPFCGSSECERIDRLNGGAWSNKHQKMHGKLVSTPDFLKPAQKFRKKPVVIEAVQLDTSGRHKFNLPEGVVGTALPTADNWNYEGCYFFIETLEGRMEAKRGDWIITGVNGEKYPCKPDIFEKSYEAVAEPLAPTSHQMPLASAGGG